MRCEIREEPSNFSILITAGPTREKIDPVRFISNYSTGTFGYEIARQAKAIGCKVTLVSGPTCLKASKGVKVVHVESAEEMRRAVNKAFAKADCVIMAAAVADWRVKRPASGKIKKRPGKKVLELIENPDILRELGKKKAGRVLVGFALETDDLENNALKKLKEKNLDFIVANRLTPQANIFGNNNIDVSIIDKYGNISRITHKTKAKTAKIVLDKILAFNI